MSTFLLDWMPSLLACHYVGMVLLWLTDKRFRNDAVMALMAWPVFFVIDVARSVRGDSNDS